MSMAAIFLAQATNTHLDFGQQLTLLLVAVLSSKGASGVATVVISRWEKEVTPAQLNANMNRPPSTVDIAHIPS